MMLYIMETGDEPWTHWRKAYSYSGSASYM